MYYTDENVPTSVTTLLYKRCTRYLSRYVSLEKERKFIDNQQVDETAAPVHLEI